MAADPRWKDSLIHEYQMLEDDEQETFVRVAKPILIKGWRIYPIAGWEREGDESLRWMGYYAVKEKVTDIEKDQVVVQIPGPINLETADKAYIKMNAALIKV